MSLGESSLSLLSLLLSDENVESTFKDSANARWRWLEVVGRPQRLFLFSLIFWAAF